jgi:pimeloyl-ACP methyl ester carboxylesterase
MRLLHVGDPGRQLLATLHQPERSRPPTAGVVLCNPFGEEAARAHRLYRVLATQLERAGYPTLRFDYSGTGDSEGESPNATLTSWLEDTCRAAAELQAITGVRRTVLVGLRFGATVAAQAARRQPMRVRHAVLWDPVVSGRPYLDELRHQHNEYMRGEVDDWKPSDPRGDAPPTEALGFPISSVLAEEIAAIDLERDGVAADHVTVISTTAPSPSMDRFVARLPPGQTRVLALEADAAWNSDAALNASVVPMTVLRAIVSRVQEVSP